MPTTDFRPVTWTRRCEQNANPRVTTGWGGGDQVVAGGGMGGIGSGGGVASGSMPSTIIAEFDAHSAHASVQLSASPGVAAP